MLYQPQEVWDRCKGHFAFWGIWGFSHFDRKCRTNLVSVLKKAPIGFGQKSWAQGLSPPYFWAFWDPLFAPPSGPHFRVILGPFHLILISFPSHRHLVSVSSSSHFRLIFVSSTSLSSQNKVDCKVHVTSCLTGVCELIAIPATGGLGPV